ncbi:MAG: hypothetical protein AAFR87_26530 [Bacteroidota bacterium]
MFILIVRLIDLLYVITNEAWDPYHMLFLFCMGFLWVLDTGIWHIQQESLLHEEKNIYGFRTHFLLIPGLWILAYLALWTLATLKAFDLV